MFIRGRVFVEVLIFLISIYFVHFKMSINFVYVMLQRVQNNAAHIITGNSDYIDTQSIDLLCSLRWVNVQERCDYFTTVLMFKAIHGLTLMYMTNNIVMARETYDPDTRLFDSNNVNTPPHNSDALKQSSIYNGSVMWNNLPDEIRWLPMCQMLNGDTSVLSQIICSKTDDVHLYRSWLQLEIVDQWSTRIPPPHRRGWHCSKLQGSHFESDIADNC